MRVSFKKGPSGGDLEDRTVPARKGVLLIGSINPLEALVVLAADTNPRGYLMHLIAPTSPQLEVIRGRESGEYQDVGGQHYDWDYAQSVFQRYAIGFSEKTVLAAAEKVRTAQRYLHSGSVYEADRTLEVKHSEPYSAFRDLLMNSEPQGYVRAMLCFGQKDPTPASVDAAYQQLVQQYTEATVLETARKMAARQASPFFATLFDADYVTLKGVLGGSISLKSATPEVPLSENPEFRAWRAFKPDAKTQGLLSSWSNQGQRQRISYPTMSVTRVLKSSNDRFVKLSATYVSHFQNSSNPPDDREEYIQSQIIPLKKDAQVSSGFETLKVGGKSLLGRWQTVRWQEADGMKTVETDWFNESVPGAKVRSLSHHIARNSGIEGFSDWTLLGYQGTPVNPITPPTLPRGQSETPSGYSSITSPALPKP